MAVLWSAGACATRANRFDHVLSESWSVNDVSWSECAMRGLTEELDLTEPHQEDLDVVSVEVHDSNFANQAP